MPKPFELNLRHLDAIVAIARVGRLKLAATAVNMTQPALTQAVSGLEREIGTRLFDRLPTGMHPTVAGIMLIDRCERALRYLTEGCGADDTFSARVALVANPGRRLSMRQLHVFLAIDRQRDIQLAAEELGVGHITVSQTIRQLELVLGEELLRDSSRSVHLTDAGERLARGAGLAVAELRAGLDDLDAHRDGDSASIAIGTLALPGATLLPEALASFSATRSKLNIQVIEGSYLELMAKLRSGELDLVLGGLRSGPVTEDLVQSPLFEEDLFVVASSQHPMAGSQMDPAALARFPWIVAPPNSPVRKAWDELFAGLAPPKLLQCGSATTISALLQAGHWLALLSPGQFRVESAAGRLRAIGGALPGSRRRLGIISRKDWQPARSQKQFLELLTRLSAVPDAGGTPADRPDTVRRSGRGRARPNVGDPRP